MTAVMPLFAPLYTVGSERAEVRWLSIVYETDPARLDEVLPRPLTLSDRAEVIVWGADFVRAKFQGESGTRELPRYTQGGIAVRARHLGEEVAYPLVSYITGPNHGFTGRELFGLPKKQARAVELTEQDDEVTMSITTAGDIEIVRAIGRIGATLPAQELVPSWFGRQRTVKLIPSATGTGYDVRQLTAVPFTFDEQRDVRAVDAELALTHAPADPVAMLPCLRVQHAAIGDMLLGVGYGRYLGEPETLPVWGRL
ncbi:MAG: hypothetical protein BGN97_11065 [Microbacterium sp. 69-10]|uniref:acetoacetate decarboxylase family protein n=1 Tax=Microbacterium sp. 69-10 TaxID=1895783 RepID=UPI000962D6CE|nr:acetoacetate decarboxylase family protein [Microbacterium sp. 69-10]OJU40382.1 MAG: hypothetical protein BGN97_11065 [Microbacterium sp. 69-10]